MSFKPLTGQKVNLEESNGMWKGDDVNLSGLHDWVRKRLPKPDKCARCKKIPPVDLANKGIYDRNLDNWEYLCRRCHMLSDGRLNRLISYSKAKKIPDRECRHCGKQFTPGNAVKRYCTKSCARSASNSNRMKNKTCLECGTEFSGYPPKLTCSEKCKRARKVHQQTARREDAEGKST